MNLLQPGLVNPTTWDTPTLVTLGDHVIHELALNSVGIDTSYRLTLGRCLLAVDETKLYTKFGCSGAVHYGVSRLGIGVRHARTVRRVARCLEGLPQLRHAAEQGEIPWGKLREIVSKATAETEAAWLELAKRLSYPEIERLVRATEFGKQPWDECSDVEPETRLRLHFGAEMGEVFERARAALSERFGKPVSVSEALEHLSLEFLAGKTLTAEKVKNAKLEAKRGSRVAKLKNAQLVEAAREIVEGEQALMSEALGCRSPVHSRSVVSGGQSGAVSNSPSVSSDHGAVSGTSSPEKTPNSGASHSHSQAGVQSEKRPVRDASPAPPQLAWRNPRLRYRATARSATRAQRRELLRRDGHCCSTPGCPNKHWLELHHVVSFANKGVTLPENLVTLCSRCHKHYHDGHLRIEQTADSRLVFTDAEGTDLARQVRIQVAGWINFWLGWEGGPHNCYIRRWAMSA